MVIFKFAQIQSQRKLINDKSDPAKVTDDIIYNLYADAAFIARSI